MADEQPQCFVLFVTEKERLLFDQLKGKQWQDITSLPHHYQKALKHLAMLGILEKNTRGELRMSTSRQLPLMVPIISRRPYWLEHVRYALVRAIQAEFRPDHENENISGSWALKQFIQTWCKKHQYDEGYFKAGAWLRSPYIHQMPSQGSGLLFNQDGRIYVSVEGFEAFELFDTSVTKRIHPRASPQAPSQEPAPESSVSMGAVSDALETSPPSTPKLGVQDPVDPVPPSPEMAPARPREKEKAVRTNASNGYAYLTGVIDDLKAELKDAERQLAQTDRSIAKLQIARETLTKTVEKTREDIDRLETSAKHLQTDN
ncbi:MAG: hypothetical protein U0487_01765 [Patescibacteria group bacterium]